MIKTSSIFLIAVCLLSALRVSGQESRVDSSDISNNYWTAGGFTASWNVTFSDPFDLPTTPTIPFFSCSSGLITKKKGAIPLSSLNVVTTKADTTQIDCGTLWNDEYLLESDRIQPQGYDSASKFLEDCALYPDSWRMFSDIDGDVSAWNGGGTGRWSDFLAFLKKVLYNNPDTNWYCDDVLDMLSALQNNHGPIQAMSQYIAQSGKCPEFTSYFQSLDSAGYVLRHQDWLDSIENRYAYLNYPPSGKGELLYNDSIKADTLAHPFDTTSQTLWQDNLQILMGPQYAGVQSSSPITSQDLLSAQLLENPMQDEIDVSYEMGRTALVAMELRDILGRSVPIANAKYQLAQPGDHTASIPAPNLSRGIYYLRITTDVGDAITLKIVKE